MRKKMLEIDPDLHQRLVKVSTLLGIKVKDATAEAVKKYLEQIDYGELVKKITHKNNAKETHNQN